MDVAAVLVVDFVVVFAVVVCRAFVSEEGVGERTERVFSVKEAEAPWRWRLD